MFHWMIGFAILLVMPMVAAQSVVIPDNPHPYQQDKVRFDFENVPARLTIREFRTRWIGDSLVKSGIRRTMQLELDAHGNLRRYVRKSPHGTKVQTYHYAYGPHGPTQVVVREESGMPREFRTYHYNNRGQLQKVEIFDHYRRPIATYHYTWKGNHLTKEVLMHADRVFNHTRVFEYDNEGRLIKDVLRNASDSEEIQIIYSYHDNRIDRIRTVAADADPKEQIFYYDDQGRRQIVQEIQNGDTTTIYFYYPDPTAVDWSRKVRIGRHPVIVERRWEQ